MQLSLRSYGNNSLNSSRNDCCRDRFLSRHCSHRWDERYTRVHCITVWSKPCRTLCFNIERTRGDLMQTNPKGAQSRFAHFEKFSLNFSNSSFAIRVNLRHPCSFMNGLILSLWCFSIWGNYYFKVSFHVKEIMYVAKRKRQNTVTELL